MAAHAQLARYALNNITHRKLRSWLTILGVVIGIAAVAVIVALAQGLDASIRTELGKLGTNYVLVLPGSPFNQGFSFGPPVFKGALYESDAEAIRKIPGVKAVSGIVMLAIVDVSYRGENFSTGVGGVDPEAYAEFINVGYEAGGFIPDGDANGVVIGNGIAHDFFSEDVKLGRTIAIGGREFKVKGIIEKGGTTSAFDKMLFIDKKAAREILGTGTQQNTLDRLVAITEKDADPLKVDKAIQRELVRRHKVDPDKKDFSTLTAASISQQVGTITGLLSLFLGAIAAISLLVGGIGIANAMFTSVVERTKEIGVLKAIGATNKAILEVFLIEAGLIGLIGGITGVALAFVVVKIIGGFGVPAMLTPELVAFCVAFSVAVGAAAGFFPARRAASLQPVTALGYEG